MAGNIFILIHKESLCANTGYTERVILVVYCLHWIIKSAVIRLFMMGEYELWLMTWNQQTNGRVLAKTSNVPITLMNFGKVMNQTFTFSRTLGFL